MIQFTRFLRFNRATQTMDDYLARADLLRREAESRTQMGDSSPETFASILCMQSASPPWADKSPGLASAQRTSGRAAAAEQMRRQLGPLNNVA